LDYQAVNAMLEPSAPSPRAMLADQGYNSDSFRQDLLIHETLPVIPSRKSRSVLHEVPQYRRSKALDWIFCQRDLEPSPDQGETLQNPPSGKTLRVDHPNRSTAKVAFQHQKKLSCLIPSPHHKMRNEIIEDASQPRGFLESSSWQNAAFHATLMAASKPQRSPAEGSSAFRMIFLDQCLPDTPRLIRKTGCIIIIENNCAARCVIKPLTRPRYMPI